MPTRALQPCPTPGCPTLTAGGPCDTCRPERAKRRNRRGEPWSTSSWQNTRATAKTAAPTCALCPHPTHAIDHRIPRRILVAAGIHDPDHPRWLQPLCEPHHNHKTATIDKPLLRRLDQGHNPTELAHEADQATTNPTLGGHP